MRKLLFGLALSFLFVQASQAADKTVKCEITNGSQKAFNGKCTFLLEEGGSFSLSNLNKQKPLYGNILVVSVSIIEKGVAEVRGLTKDGNNSRWGEAKRSAKDPACWVGSDFKVCAR